MTVSYQYDVASSTSGGFTRLLFKWKGSLYKLVYRELFMFCVGYGMMSATYRCWFTKEQQRKFEEAVIYCDTYMNYIPLSFILGFYVSFVASRWWQQYMAIPWPDKIIHAIALHVTGYDERSRIMRRTLARYLNLSLVLILRSISSAVKKRFPTLDHLVEAGFITSTELGIYNMVPNKEFNTYWVPCTWFTSLLKDVKAQKRIPDPMGMKHIMEEFNEFRQKCGMLWSYDWVSIPLVYTQVVTIATYAFFLAAIVGRQYVQMESMHAPPYKKIDLYIPFFTLLQFFFYMGLLKVAEALINPFGDDDEDFELNWIIDRHMKVSYLIVDTLLLRTPPLAKDIFYDDECPVLPYTEASAEFKKRTYRGSVANMVIPEDKQNLILPDIQEEGEEDFQAQGSLSSSQQPSARTSVNTLPGPVAASKKEEKVENEEKVESDREPKKAANRSIRRSKSQPTFRRKGSKDVRSLSVPEDGLAADLRSPSPRDGRKEVKSAPLSRVPSSRRAATAGSKGIGSALLAVGSHQGFLAADPEKISLASGKFTSVTSTDKLEEEQLDSLRLLSNWGKVSETSDSVTVDLSTVTDDEEMMKEDKPKSSIKSSLRLPASLKARLAIRKKPVITWRPYERQVTIEQEMPEEFQSIPAGEFEDECAFMWRTIEDDGDSLKTTLSTPSEDLRSDAICSDVTFLSHYKDIKPHPPDRRPESLALPKVYGDPRQQRIIIRRTPGLRRARYKTRSRMRCMACSMPLLSCAPRGSISLMPSLVKSISENSVFVEAVSRRLSAYSRSQDKSLTLRPSNASSSTTLPIWKQAANGKQSTSSDTNLFGTK